ncbi:MAG TPA: helix-hairpin-helix domain-containing protein [Acidimicrobiales bacterium]|nr:helix-hairpin-helix domain-containing protein [Acidimicrobiales bacterium]
MPDLLPVPPPLGWRARLEVLLRQRPLQTSRVVVALVGAVLLVAGGVLALVWILHSPPPSEALIPQVTAPSVSSALGVPTTGDVIVVQAAGAVLSPGVYRMPGNARVVDVIDAAGGLAPSADPDRLALAAKVTDGERVYVPKVGEPLPAASATGAATPAGPLDLNTASETELDALPGVGPATAAAIVSYREHHGAFTSVDQLLEVRGIGPAKLDQIAPLVRV